MIFSGTLLPNRQYSYSAKIFGSQNPRQCHPCQEIRPCFFWGGIMNLYNSIYRQHQDPIPREGDQFGGPIAPSHDLLPMFLYLKVDIQSSKLYPLLNQRFHTLRRPETYPSPVESWNSSPVKRGSFVWSTDCLTLADLLCIIWVVWWFQPIWKIWVKLGSSSPNKGKNTKDLSCHQLVLCIIWMYPPQDASVTSGMPHHAEGLDGGSLSFFGCQKPAGVCFKRPMNVFFDVRHVYILKNRAGKRTYVYM